MLRIAHCVAAFAPADLLLAGCGPAGPLFRNIDIILFRGLLNL